MPKQEGGGPGEERPEDEAFDYGKMPEASEIDTQPIPGIPTSEEVAKKSRDKLVHEGIKKAENINEALDVLQDQGYIEVAQKIIDVMNDADSLLRDRPDTSQETIANALEDSAMFKDKEYQTKYPYLDRKIRKLLIEYLNKKLLK